MSEFIVTWKHLITGEIVTKVSISWEYNLQHSSIILGETGATIYIWGYLGNQVGYKPGV